MVQIVPRIYSSVLRGMTTKTASNVNNNISLTIAPFGKSLAPSSRLFRHCYVPFQGLVSEGILVTKVYNQFQPWEHGVQYIEIMSEDIFLREALPMIVTESGQSISCTRVWVRKGSKVRRVCPVTV